MTKREERVINAFVECVKKGEFSLEYATTLIEDNNKYGYLTDEAKEVFYAEFEKPIEEPIEEPENVESEVIPNESELEGEI
jgi:hypothetical protein